MLCDNRSLQTVSTRASEQRREDRSDRFDENKLTGIRAKKPACLRLNMRTS